MTTPNAGAKGPGPRREGFSFDDGKKDRDGRKGGKDGKKGGGAGYRVVNELSSLEKALTKADFGAQLGPLEEVLKSLKPMHLRSIDDLDPNTRGKLITSLVRVVRQPKPKLDAPAEAPAGEAAPAADAAPAAEAAPSTEAAPATDAAPEAASSPEGAGPASDAAQVAAPPEAPAAPTADSKVKQYGDVAFTVGLIWSAVGSTDRAAVAFELAGRQPTAAELAAPPRVERIERSEAPGRGGPRGEKRDRKDRPARPERTERPPRQEMFVSSGDWQADAKKLEGLGRTRDAGRIHEKHQSYADAARLFEGGGDLTAALRCAAAGKLADRIEALSAKVKPEDVALSLERAEAWELLMAFHVKRQDFDAIARLYERTKQFDQAAAAYERAGKLSLSRKAYERAKDLVSANRVRELEVQKLIERGDRFGAATLLMGVGKKAEALEVVKPLPATKAFHFIEKLKLADEAKAFGQEELKKAEASGNLVHVARWHELLGDRARAAEIYLSADRKDKAAAVFESMGQLPRAAELFEASGELDRAAVLYKKAGDEANATRVAALPRPEPRPPRADAPDAADEGTTLPAAAVPEAAPQAAPSASA